MSRVSVVRIRKTLLLLVNTPYANMADHSVVAWNELFLFRFPYEFLCSCMPPEGIEIVQRWPLREKSGSMQFIKTKEVSSRSPRELKFARYIFRLEDF